MSSSLAVIFALASQSFNLPPGLLSALCYAETRHKPYKVLIERDGKESLGLCQMKLDTARMLGYNGSRERLLTPGINAHYAAAYLRKQLNRYNQDPRKAAAAYNAGRYRLNSRGQIKNRQYVERVMNAWAEGL